MEKTRAILTIEARRPQALFCILLPFTFFLIAFLFPVAAHAQTPPRCGFSFGATPGAGVHTDPDMRKEFPYVFAADIEGKYYLWKPFSLSGDLGFLYASGKPEREEVHEKLVTINKDGRSYLRAGTGDVLARIEIGRFWTANPYVGGGAGGMFNSMSRYGISNNVGQKVDYQEWLWHYVALAGFDYLFDQYVALKFEARWSFARSRSIFVEKKDLGLWYGVLGVQIYL